MRTPVGLPKLGVTYASAPGASSLAKGIAGSGGRATFLHHDVTSPADWERAAATATATYGGLDVLVNNAGMGAAGPPGGCPERRWLDEETGQRGFVLSGDEAFLQPYTAGQAQAAKLQAEVDLLLARDREAAQLMTTTIHAARLWPDPETRSQRGGGPARTAAQRPAIGTCPHRASGSGRSRSPRTGGR